MHVTKYDDTMNAEERPGGYNQSRQYIPNHTPRSSISSDTSSTALRHSYERQDNPQSAKQYKAYCGTSPSISSFRETAPARYTQRTGSAFQQTRQADQPAKESNGNKTWAQIWADIEKGNLASPSRPAQSPEVVDGSAGFYTQHFGGQRGPRAAQSGPVGLLARARNFLRPARSRAPVTLATTTASLSQETPSHSRSNSRVFQPSSPEPKAATSVQYSDKSLPEAKESMSASLYRSTPIRLLAIVILFFNTLLVLRVVADPSTPFYSEGSTDSRMVPNNGGEGPQQIPLTVATLEENIPCVPATSHNDEMQPAPFVGYASSPFLC